METQPTTWRDLVPPLALRAARTARDRRRPPTTRTALGGLEERIAAFLPPGTGYYVELGANDGVDQSNTLWLERERGWRGLLIEPVPHRYFELLANRDDGNDFACAACVPLDHAEQFVEITYANLMTVSTGLETTLDAVDAHLEAAREHLPQGEEVVVFGALARPLQHLLDEAGAPARVDLLSLDVEGAELAVLAGVDHDRTRFATMVVETSDPDRVTAFLTERGYAHRGRISHHDHVFVDVSAGASTL